VAYNAVCVNGRVRPGDHVLVIAGPIGLLCALMAKLSGAGHLIVSGLPPIKRRLAVAGQVGRECCTGGRRAGYITDLGDGYGVDVVIDATGASAVCNWPCRPSAPAGKSSRSAGDRNRWATAWIHSCKSRDPPRKLLHNLPVWERVISMIASGQIKFGARAQPGRPPGRLEECFTKMHAGEYVKVVLKPNG